MAPRNANTKLEKARTLIEQAQPKQREQKSVHPVTSNQNSEPPNWVEIYFRITGIDLTKCPACGGSLIRRPLVALDQATLFGSQGIGFLDSS